MAVDSEEVVVVADGDSDGDAAACERTRIDVVDDFMRSGLLCCCGSFCEDDASVAQRASAVPPREADLATTKEFMMIMEQ